jgi:hypothetical protein
MERIRIPPKAKRARRDQWVYRPRKAKQPAVTAQRPRPAVDYNAALDMSLEDGLKHLVRHGTSLEKLYASMLIKTLLAEWSAQDRLDAEEGGLK